MIHRHIKVLLTAVATLGAAAAVAHPAAAAKVPTAKHYDPEGTEVLSNERTLTRWANAAAKGAIRREPNGSSKTIENLHFRTEDGPLEVYLVLRSHFDADQQKMWVQVRIPGRPNGRKGWVRRDDLGPLHLVTTRLIIDRNRLTATLFKKNRRIWSSRVGVGKASTPTPKGKFWIRERLKSLGGAYGPWAFGTSAYSALSDWPGGGVVGIHGTNQPELIPGRPSHGCVRVPNAKIIRLARIMPIGTPLLVK